MNLFQQLLEYKEAILAVAFLVMVMHKAYRIFVGHVAEQVADHIEETSGVSFPQTTLMRHTKDLNVLTERTEYHRDRLDAYQDRLVTMEDDNREVIEPMRGSLKSLHDWNTGIDRRASELTRRVEALESRPVGGGICEDTKASILARLSALEAQAPLLDQEESRSDLQAVYGARNADQHIQNLTVSCTAGVTVDHAMFAEALTTSVQKSGKRISIGTLTLRAGAGGAIDLARVLDAAKARDVVLIETIVARVGAGGVIEPPRGVFSLFSRSSSARRPPILVDRILVHGGASSVIDMAGVRNTLKAARIIAFADDPESSVIGCPCATYAVFTGVKHIDKDHPLWQQHIAST